MLKPALAILASVASCKLPLGSPIFKICLSLILPNFLFGAGPRILRGGIFDPRHRVDFPSLARQSHLFLLFAFHVRPAKLMPFGHSQAGGQDEISGQMNKSKDRKHRNVAKSLDRAACQKRSDAASN